MTSISTLLVANRGEIALRVMRSARALGMRTVAVYSDPDASAPHVQFADARVRLGAGPVSESYLLADAVIAAALEQGAEAIHPGYGLLSENAEFAQAVVDAGLVFVGPSSSAIALMGDKARAKRRMIEAGVPCIPGYQDAEQAVEQFVAAAAEIGYPVMVKAAAGGGGRGMRLVADEAELKGALEVASAEAASAFGSGTLILEKAIVQPRHVEIQVFADRDGNTVYLGERDCSVQRRHQKIIEEAPCPVLTEDLRRAMGEAAVEAARAVDYEGAGTVEFLLDSDGQFYFLEMNTRLQVEHPVTELITGLDLVALQLQVAQGQPLGFAQQDVRLTGHAIEVRLYAEDPARGFLPRTGPVFCWEPATGDGLRTDAGIATGGEVSPYYDSMLAKIIGYGQTREEARRRLLRGLTDTVLFGVTSNREFLLDALQQPEFAAGRATTAFIDETYGEAGYTEQPLEATVLAAAGVIQHRLAQARAKQAALAVSEGLLGWSSDQRGQSVVEYDAPDGPQRVAVQGGPGSEYTVDVAGAQHVVRVQSWSDGRARLQVDGAAMPIAFFAETDRILHLAAAAGSHVLTNVAGVGRGGEEAAGGGTVVAPMHGQLVSVDVAVGDSVKVDARLAVLEAMKMQHEICASVAGTIIEVLVEEGAQVGAEDVILRIEPN